MAESSDPGAIAGDLGAWESFAETAVLLSGAWIVFASGSRLEHRRYLRFFGGDSGVRLARMLFGFSLVLFGLAHFGYLKYTAALVPGWLPWPMGWASLTGSAYIAAGLGILCGILPRLAAALTAAMMSLFQVLIWVPHVIAMPTNQSQWSELLIGWALAFSAWAVTDSYRATAWWSAGIFSRIRARPGSGTAA